MKTVPLNKLFIIISNISYQIDVDELDADYEQYLQIERDKPPELYSTDTKSDSDGKDA